MVEDMGRVCPWNVINFIDRGVRSKEIQQIIQMIVLHSISNLRFGLCKFYLISIVIMIRFRRMV